MNLWCKRIIEVRLQMNKNDDVRIRAGTLSQEKAAHFLENLEAFSTEEIRQMFLEQQAHQIALETRNEELRRAQMELDSTRRRYFYLYDLAPVGYLTLSEQGLILEANLTAAKLLGMARGELFKQSLARFLHPDSQNDYHLHRKQMFETERPQTCDFRMVKKDGTQFWARLEAIAAKGEDGAPVCLAAMSDASERNQTESKLRESNELLFLFIKHSPIFAYIKEVTATESRVLVASENFEEMIGKPGSEMAGKTMEELFPPEFAKTISADDWAVVSSGKILKRDEDLNGRNYATIKFPILRENKRLLAGYTIDITERKQSEDLLRNSEERYRGLVDLAVDGILLGSHEGMIIDANKYMSTITGMAREDLVGKLISDLRFTKESFAKNPLRFDLLEKGEIVLSERMMTRPDGSEVSVEMRTKMMPDGTYQSIYRDITERKAIEYKLRQTQKMESVGRLAGGVAHDFNNMLGVILGFVELTLDKIDIAHSIHGDLLEIQKAATRSAALTRQLLAFASLQPADTKVLDLNETVEGMLKMLRRLIGENIHLVWMRGTDLWPVKMDPSQIDQILVNLCVNARDAISGSGQLSIGTRNVTFDATFCKDYPDCIPGDYVGLFVSDDGCGMDKETLANIFEPFFTTKGLAEGTGLGLATIYGIVRQNSGFIKVDSAPGIGTNFNIYLPRHAVPITQIRAHKASESLKGGKETILVVEDEPSVLKVAEMMLVHLGYTVLAANTPDEALRISATYAGGIDLLITDVLMPELNGKDLAGKMQSLYPRQKSLFMSGYMADIMTPDDTLGKGVHFIQKPFTIKGLASRVREVLDGDEP